MQSNNSRVSANNAAHSRQSYPSSTSSSGSSTPPLRTSKTTTAYASETTLIGGVKGGPLLARRQSASFNHVRTSSLVSSSPFKTGGNTTSSTPAVKPRPQNNPSQFQHGEAHRHSSSGDQLTNNLPHSRSRSDENKLFTSSSKPRERKSFQKLPQAEAVTKSPFVEANSLPPGSKHTTTRSVEHPSHVADPTASHRVSKSSTHPSMSGLSSTSSDAAAGSPLLAPNHVLSGRPLPGTPQRPRPVSMFVQGSTPVSTSPTTRSVLASRQMLGPRSPKEPVDNRSFTSSPEHYERRKTVTWDERCDVVEFEQDDGDSILTESVSDSQEVGDSENETETELEDVPPAVPPKHQERDWFGPDREDGRSPSPTFSGSINDGDMGSDKFSTDPMSDDDDMPTPQRETFDLPTEGLRGHETDIGSISAATIPRRPGSDSFLEGSNSFRDDSVSSHDGSFRSRDEEPVIETSKLAEARSPEKFPRISRDAIRKQVEQQRLSANLDEDNSVRRLSIGDERRSSRGGSGYNSPLRKFENSPMPSPKPRPRSEPVFTSTNVNLEDVQSALDRLMLGVEKGFEPSIRSNATEQDYDETSSVGDDYTPKSYGEPPEHQHDGTPRENEYLEPSGAQLHRQSTATSGTSTESTDGPYTPDIHGVAHPELPSEAQDTDSMYETSKPLPAPPLEMEPSPVMHQAHLQDEIPTVEVSLAVPAVTSVRRGSTIKRHEEAIKAKRREQRALEGRPTKRRSHSTGDLQAQYSPEPEHLEIDNQNDMDLTDAFQSEVAKLHPAKKSYMMKQRRPTIYASDSRVGNGGDGPKGRPWRTVRHPSDMNEYSKQIRQLRQLEKGAAPPGKVFVRVLGVRNLEVPLPVQPTYFTCVLNNGIHFVETPAGKLEMDESIIDQEFELIEHEKLEFTLTIKVRKDAHIAQILNPPARTAYSPPAVRVDTPTKAKSGVRSFFSTPKKPKHAAIREVEATPAPVQTSDPFGRYLKQDLSIARALVSFKEIVGHCDTKLFETSYPLIGQCSEGGDLTTKTIGEIVLQIFRLPPLPGLPVDDLPQSLEECQRGLRHVQWHKTVYHEGVLTQLGGDCTTWRRRNLQVMGANLIAFNDVTKRPITTMDLRKITLVEDNGRGGVPETVITPPANAMEGGLGVPKLKRQRSFNALASIDHSFRVVFDGDENDEVCFFADSAEEKTRWMEIFGALVGRIPHYPLWAELIWQRQQTV